MFPFVTPEEQEVLGRVGRAAQSGESAGESFHSCIISRVDVLFLAAGSRRSHSSREVWANPTGLPEPFESQVRRSPGFPSWFRKWSD